MIRYIRTWWTVITGIGSGMRLGRQADQIFRYYVLETLKDEGLFEYLREPRTYGQILAEFRFMDSEYSRELIDILIADKKSVVTASNGLIQLNPSQPFPDIGRIINRTDRRIRDFSLMAKGMTRNIPSRLRNEPIEFSETFEQDGRQLLTKFDKTLGSRIYSALRDAAFAFLTGDERKFLEGCTLLDVGCGSGRETAELWLKMNGKIKITGVDPVASMLEIADQGFSDMLDQLAPGHAPLTEENRPVFTPASATRLPFDDNTFDAAFHSLVLHWTPDPQKAIAEIVRVLKPGGLVFGTQGTKPYLDPYFDLVIRTHENSHGFFWKEDFLRWYAKQGVKLEMMQPAGLFRGRKLG